MLPETRDGLDLGVLEVHAERLAFSKAASMSGVSKAQWLMAPVVIGAGSPSQVSMVRWP